MRAAAALGTILGLSLGLAHGATARADDAARAAADGAPSPTGTEQAAAPSGTALEGTPSPAGGELEAGAALRAYHAALAARRLDASEPLSVPVLGERLAAAQAQLALGRRAEAIGALAALAESPRFRPFAALDEGRAVVFTLGDALGRVGAHGVARAYLRRIVAAPPADEWTRRAVASLVDFALASAEPEPFLAELSALPAGPGAWSGDLAYLTGVVHERAGRNSDALAAYAAVPAAHRFWAQATYRSGLLHVEARRFAEGEAKFCSIAAPRETPRLAPLYGGNEFFMVRDLARLALGRVAHERYRFDDARYYYHLVPADSEHLPEALYEAATARYEAKDYATARDLLDELRRLEREHGYADEAWILDAYVDLAQCQFARADAKLIEFARRYEPVLDGARRLRAEPAALEGLLGEAASGDLAAVGLAPEVAAVLATTVRMDPEYRAAARRRRDLEHELGALATTRAALAELAVRAAPSGATAPRAAAPLADSSDERRARLAEQLSAARAKLHAAAVRRGADAPEVVALRRELDVAGAELAALTSGSAESAQGGAASDALAPLLASDTSLAGELDASGRALRSELALRERAVAAAALERLERRLVRLVRRARAGRIETVLGRKHSLEVEVEALSQGFLPPGAVDSLDAARYLADDEEYWPADGEDWEDEYTGGEGL